jgi:hypothetical protein
MRKFLVLVVLLVGFCCGELRAQSTNASVTGYITDPTKAVIAGAKVIVINVGTNIRYEATTNNAGSYDVTNLPPGPYRIEVEKPGFKTVVKSDLVLHVQNTAAVNFEMAIGSASEIVTVTAGGLVINTTDATVSTVIDRQFAENLPMNGRSFQTLIELTPGVVLTASNAEDNGQFSVNGQRAVSNYWMVDGVSANVGIGFGAGPDPGNGLGGALGSFSAMGGTNSLVSVDAMQEFRIQTSTYAPEFGRTPGGQISIVTRSGVNQFHGTAFDYLRNDEFDANNWFNNFVTPPLPKARERQNDFGGTFGGPILKDKTFFFFSYEGLRLRLPQTAITTVPDLGARKNAIPALQPFLNAFPLPNGPDNLTTGVAQFNSSFSNPSTLDAYSLRVDHKLNDRLNLFGRYDYSPFQVTLRGNGGSLSQVSPTRSTTQTATLGATLVISPKVSNDLRFNYSRMNVFKHSDLDNFGGALPLASLPFPSPFTAQNGLFAANIFSLTQGGLAVGQNGQHLQRQINVVDSLSIQRGSHSLKFGVDYRRLSPLSRPSTYLQEAIFNDVPSAENGNLLFSNIVFNLNPTFLFRNLGIYAQDTWRLLPRLTLTYGLRWDVDFVPRSLSGPSLNSVTGFNLNDLSNLALAPAGTAPYTTTYGNVAPRFGAAYQLNENQDWQTVLRGGFGVFYDLATSEVGNNLGLGTYPFGSQTPFSFGGTFPLSPAAAAPLPITPPSVINQQALYAFDPHLKLPYTLEWNVALEQALGKQQTISASYIGAAGRRLLATAFVFTPTNPNLGGANLVVNAGTSDYDALQVQFQRRLSHGLQALASYTWSHSIDTGSAGSTDIVSNSLVHSAIAGSNRGSSDFDIRNAFSAGVTYDIPAPRTNAFVRTTLRGWSIQNFILARSAPPVTVLGFFKGIGVNTIAGYNTFLRPDLVPGQPLYLYGTNCASVMQALGNLAAGQGCPGGKGFNPAAFAPAPIDPRAGAPLRQGNLGRNALRGFGAAQWDFALHREFPIHESLKLQFRAEMFNVLNHPNFGPPNGLSGQGAFGVSTQMLGSSLSGGLGGNSGGGAFDPLYQIGGPRSMQFALKLTF